MPRWIEKPVDHLSDKEYQDHILEGVSRTFALTIPQLPPPLQIAIGNAYLLCRVTDTIEDDTSLAADEKRDFSRRFAGVVADTESVDSFVHALYPKLAAKTPAAEKNLIQNTSKVISITHQLSETQRDAMQRCVTVMAHGMSHFQENANAEGLESLAHLNSYCYYVAGVVGEMLTELFCDYSEEIAKNRARMLTLAVSCGQGLQMTNILKDIWEDRSRNVCWLPKDVFQQYGFDLKNLSKNGYEESFGKGLSELIGVANNHLHNALTYTLLIPKKEQGIRRFCFWAFDMALLTLRKINNNPAFTSGRRVTISRRTLKTAIIISNFSLVSNRLTRALFALSSMGLPRNINLTDLPSGSQHQRLVN